MALEDAMKELYTSAKCTKLLATILLMNLCTIHGVSKFFVDEFAFLHLHLLPEPNYLVGNYYVVRTLIRNLGLNYKNIHACVKGCVLFLGDHKDAIHCPKRG